MRFPRGLVFFAILLMVPATVATVVEFNEGQHTGRSEFSGHLSATVLFADGHEWPFNAIQASADELVIREATTDYYVEMDNGPHYARAPNHNEITLHNARFQATPREDATYAAFHAIDSASITYHSDAALTAPPSDESFEDINWIQMAEPRTSDVSSTLDVASQGHVEAEIEGGVSVNLWGWNVRITSDEGTFEYRTGPSRDAEAGPASVGPATQLQVESLNASVSFSGTFDEVHHVWIRDAVAESDRMDLKLTDEDLPTDQEVFNERSRLTVLDVSDTVTGNVTQALTPEPFTPNASPEPSSSIPDRTTGSGSGEAATQEDPAAPDGLGPVTTTPGHPNAAMWVLVAVATTLVAVFFAVRQTKGWPAKAFFVRRCENLHDEGRYARVTFLATVGHLLRPQNARHRFHRGMARSEREHWNGALKDLAWSSKHLRDPEEKAVSAYHAAYAAAYAGHPGIAGELLATAARVDEQFLWDAQADPALLRLSGMPEFESRLAAGLW